MKLTSNAYADKNKNTFGFDPPFDPLSIGWHRVFICYFFFVGWDAISIGFHISFSLPNIEIHIPFGFIRIGWVMRT